MILITLIIVFLILYLKNNINNPEIDKIKKPLADNNKYKLLTLKKNSLQILLISSKETQKSSSSLAINAGSFYDLTPGLAHFCEHMLFLGNKKFPSENTFSDTLSKYNGIYNAFTSNDKTVYYFESDNNGFIEIFNIFSSMFYSPLFDIKFIEKEINAVNSEHSKNINNDFWIIDFLVRREGNEKNPFWKFSCGNNETLGRINPYILQNELFSFFNCFYLPKNMKLVLYSNLTIYEMEKMINDNFNFYKSENKNELILFKKSIDGLKLPVYEKGQIPKIMFYKPSSEKNLISIYFIINSLFYLYESKPQDYLFYYFQYEGPNSLIYILKEKELITEINIYVEEMFIEFSIIKISVLLTEKGIDNYEIVIKLIFDYLNLIKNNNISEDIYKEKKANSDNEFKFFQMKNLFDLVIEYSLNMFQYNEENILYGNYLHSKFDKKL
jgi:insulysin